MIRSNHGIPIDIHVPESWSNHGITCGYTCTWIMIRSIHGIKAIDIHVPESWLLVIMV